MSGLLGAALTFYDQVLRELVAAIGAALFVGNGLALSRRRADKHRPATAGRRSTKAKGSSRLGPDRRASGELARAPLLRTLAFLALGFVMMIAGLAALAAG